MFWGTETPHIEDPCIFFYRILRRFAEFKTSSLLVYPCSIAYTVRTYLWVYCVENTLHVQVYSTYLRVYRAVDTLHVLVYIPIWFGYTACTGLHMSKWVYCVVVTLYVLVYIPVSLLWFGYATCSGLHMYLWLLCRRHTACTGLHTH